MEVNIAQGHLLLLTHAIIDFQAMSTAHTVLGIKHHTENDKMIWRTSFYLYGVSLYEEGERPPYTSSHLAHLTRYRAKNTTLPQGNDAILLANTRVTEHHREHCTHWNTLFSFFSTIQHNM